MSREYGLFMALAGLLAFVFSLSLDRAGGISLALAGGWLIGHGLCQCGWRVI